MLPLALGSLEELLKTDPKMTVLSAGQRVALAADICNGLQYVHARGFVHGNVKLSNILISYSALFCRYVALVSGFGCAAAINPLVHGVFPVDFVHHARYPECQCGPHFRSGALPVTGAADVYALGKWVFPQLLDYRSIWPCCSNTITSHGVFRFLQSCAAPNPQDRPSMSGIAQRLAEYYVGLDLSYSFR
jgi:serine/threonine protein kinase